MWALHDGNVLNILQLVACFKEPYHPEMFVMYTSFVLDAHSRGRLHYHRSLFPDGVATLFVDMIHT